MYTKESFIEKAKSVHYNKYDYSKTEYVNYSTKVCIICPKHGEFWQTPDHHLRGSGCPKCAVETKSQKAALTTEHFIERARKVHGCKYDYSKTQYINYNTKVCVICPEHGEFYVWPEAHLKGCECPRCVGNGKKTTADFIEEARKIHGDKYDYSKAEYISNSTKICIICPVHGEFWQTPAHHLRGSGCPKCSSEKASKILTSTTEEFIKKARETHGNKYDYSKVEYVNNVTNVTIICPIHGSFQQRPGNHLVGKGCTKCAQEARRQKMSLRKEQFIEKAREVHGDKYDYSKVNYINTSTKVCILCPKHGEFWQTPNNHLCGTGCPICNESKIEKEIRESLEENNINFTSQQRFTWLKNKHPMSIDFYIPTGNIGIECQGLQHFKGGGNYYFSHEKTEDIKKRDKLKHKLCKEHGIKIFYYSNLGIKYPYQVYENKEELLSEIKKIVNNKENNDKENIPNCRCSHSDISEA